MESGKAACTRPLFNVHGEPTVVGFLRDWAVTSPKTHVVAVNAEVQGQAGCRNASLEVHGRPEQKNSTKGRRKHDSLAEQAARTLPVKHRLGAGGVGLDSHHAWQRRRGFC